MKVRVLGCSGAIAKDCRTTSFLVGGDVLIDAGTGVGDLTLDEMSVIDHVLLTHSHLDHIAALPLMVDAVASKRTSPLQVYGLPGTLDAIQKHVFNNVIWPDFTRIPSPEAPFIQFNEIATGSPLLVAGKQFEVLPAVHTVPAVGYAVQTPSGYWVFSGDTERNPEFWSRINKMNVAMLVIETAFSNRERDLAKLSLHLSPYSLADELDCIAPGNNFPIFITHTKPAETELIMDEIRRFDKGHPSGAGVRHDIRWLKAGQEFDL